MDNEYINRYRYDEDSSLIEHPQKPFVRGKTAFYECKLLSFGKSFSISCNIKNDKLPIQRGIKMLINNHQGPLPVLLNGCCFEHPRKMNPHKYSTNTKDHVITNSMHGKFHISRHRVIWKAPSDQLECHSRSFHMARLAEKERCVRCSPLIFQTA